MISTLEPSENPKKQEVSEVGVGVGPGGCGLPPKMEMSLIQLREVVAKLADFSILFIILKIIIKSSIMRHLK